MYSIYQKLLDEKGLKNADVSRATGISNMTLSDWKNGKSTPKQDKLMKIAEFLGVTMDYLVTGKEPHFDFIYTDENVEFLIEIAKRNESDFERMKRFFAYYSKLSEKNKDAVEHLMASLAQEDNHDN